MTPAYTPSALFLTYLWMVGACVGSFMGVVVGRLPRGLSVVRPRSRCDGCGVQLAWYDNIPVLSYVNLRGRCRQCHQSYGVRSVILECLTGSLFVALGSLLGASWALAAWLVFVSGLVAITFLDIDHFWVPDVITYPLMAWALLWSVTPDGHGLKGALLGLIPAALLWAVAQTFSIIMGKEGIGLGDIKLLAALGLMMGLPATLGLLFLASVQGAVLGTIIVATGGHKEKQLPHEAAPERAAQEDGPEGPGGEQGQELVVAEEPWVPDPRAVPFGPFLVLGALEVLFFPGMFAQLFSHFLGLR